MKSDFRYLLDTDISSYIIRRFEKPLAKAVQFSQQFAISSVTRFELSRVRGKLNLESSRLLLSSFLDEVPTLEFDSDSADAGGRVFQELEAQGAPIGLADSMIAGQAIAQSLVLVTNNQKHFKRVPELSIQNWMD